MALYKGGPSEWKSIIFADPNDTPMGDDDEVEMNWHLKNSLCDILAAFYEVIMDIPFEKQPARLLCCPCRPLSLEIMLLFYPHALNPRSPSLVALYFPQFVTIGAEIWFVCHSLDLSSSLDNPFVSDKVFFFHFDVHFILFQFLRSS